ncbi:MAG: hypothetical protein AVDCRST_MAG06-3369, partial [uncultured Nocardioides sp.]
CPTSRPSGRRPACSSGPPSCSRAPATSCCRRSSWRRSRRGSPSTAVSSSRSRAWWRWCSASGSCCSRVIGSPWAWPRPPSSSRSSRATSRSTSRATTPSASTPTGRDWPGCSSSRCSWPGRCGAPAPGRPWRVGDLER